MSILLILVILAAIGVLSWAVNTYVPLSAGMKKVFNVATIVVTIVWLLKVLGIFDLLKSVGI